MGMNIYAYSVETENNKKIFDFADSNKFKNLYIYDRELGIILDKNLEFILHKSLSIDFSSGDFMIEPKKVNLALNKLKNYISRFIVNNKVDAMSLLELIDFFIICNQNEFYIAAG